MEKTFREYAIEDRAAKACEFPDCLDLKLSPAHECGATSPGPGYQCTRPRGHEGVHVAHGSTAIGEWDNA
jgi:hypothetical protein